jgi:tetratricopeptide (TPR) repeat protein
MTDEEWSSLEVQKPELIRAARETLTKLAHGQTTWAAALGIPDFELLNLAKLAAARMDSGRYGDAERMLLALTELDPFVGWFWQTLGDVHSRQRKTAEALAAYDRCIELACSSGAQGEELRAAFHRRAAARVQAGDALGALEDFRVVLRLDTPAVLDGERAWLALQALADAGSIPAELLENMPRPR